MVGRGRPLVMAAIDCGGGGRGERGGSQSISI